MIGAQTIPDWLAATLIEIKFSTPATLHSEFSSQTVFAQFLVSAAGIGIMVGVAYYGSWSKRIDKLHPWTISY